MKSIFKKFMKKMFQEWRRFQRRPYRKSLKEWEVFGDLLGRFETSYDLGNKSHERNMEIILRNLNNRIVLKGEYFSFNNTVGERKLERGFKEGPIVIRGQNDKRISGRYMSSYINTI